MFALQISFALSIILQLSTPNLASRIPSLLTYQEVFKDLFTNPDKQPETWGDDEFLESPSTPNNLWLLPHKQKTFPSEVWQNFAANVKPQVLKRPNAFNWAKKRSSRRPETIAGFNHHGVTFPEQYP